MGHPDLPLFTGSDKKVVTTATVPEKGQAGNQEVFQNIFDSEQKNPLLHSSRTDDLPDWKSTNLKPNVYAKPSEAIAPNGRYLISFEVTKVHRQNN
jgi:hypothetical protein